MTPSDKPMVDTAAIAQELFSDDPDMLVFTMVNVGNRHQTKDISSLAWQTLDRFLSHPRLGEWLEQFGYVKFEDMPIPYRRGYLDAVLQNANGEVPEIAGLKVIIKEKDKKLVDLQAKLDKANDNIVILNGDKESLLTALKTQGDISNNRLDSLIKCQSKLAEAVGLIKKLQDDGIELANQASARLGGLDDYPDDADEKLRRTVGESSSFLKSLEGEGK